jgi:hypothetical protein
MKVKKKNIKKCEENMHKLYDSFNRTNLQIIGIKEGEEMQAKEIWNMLNKVMPEKFSNLERRFPFSNSILLEFQADKTKIEPPHST